MQNEFDKEIKYKLYRSVREILNPTISKKNISDYRIQIDENILPVRVFYPKKVSNIEKVIIFIHGSGEVSECNGKYTNILKNFALNTNELVIAIEYIERKENAKKMYQDIYEVVKYLYKELIRNNIEEKNIALIGDSTGGNIITGINELNNKEIPIQKEILLYPALSLEYFGKTSLESLTLNQNLNFGLIERLKDYYNNISTEEERNSTLLNPFKRKNKKSPDTLIIVGKVDSLRDEAHAYYESLNSKNSRYKEFSFLSHGFLKKMDKDTEEELFKEINDFLK